MIVKLKKERKYLDRTTKKLDKNTINRLSINLANIPSPSNTLTI